MQTLCGPKEPRLPSASLHVNKPHTSVDTRKHDANDNVLSAIPGKELTISSPVSWANTSWTSSTNKETVLKN